MDTVDDLTVLDPDEPLFEENPLRKDPYIWDRCTITIKYVLLPNKTVQVSVRNHDDQPIDKEFLAPEVPLSGMIGNMLAKAHREKQPNETLYVVIALLPGFPEQGKRLATVSVWAGNEAPKVDCILETGLLLPEPINAMLDELRILLPSRGGLEIDGFYAYSLTSTDLQLARARGDFAREYCKQKGWTFETMSAEQIMEIRSQPGWEQPLVTPTKSLWASQAIQLVADFIKGLRILIRL